MLKTPENLECALIELGVIRHEPFVTAGNEPADIKVELDCLDPNKPAYDERLFILAVGGLAVKAQQLNPDFLVSAPHGANGLTKALSYKLDIPYVIPNKANKTKEISEPASKIVRMLVEKRKRGLIIDDVLTAGSTMRRIERLPLFYDRIYAGLVVWDRFPEISRGLSFKTDALINHHVPLREQKQ